MLQSKAFVKKTKKGKVLKVVREHYLRDDIWSGSPLDPECDKDAVKLSGTAAHYLVVDTNIVLQQVICTTLLFDDLRSIGLDSATFCSLLTPRSLLPQ